MVDLKRMRYLIRRYPMACLRAEQARIRAQKLTRTISDAPKGGGDLNSTEAGLCLYLKAKECKQNIEDELTRLRAELDPLLYLLDKPLDVQCMRMRYMEGRSVREISFCLAYSEQHVFRVISNAEKKVCALEKYEEA
jgi:hypothetical protein|nr:MAG TPA: Protein of unknown function (DUF1492) [Caudoviricetes sp.]